MTGISVRGLAVATPLFLALSLSLALAGCATHPERALLRSAGAKVELAGVPFFAQDAFQCGPAALATLLQDERIPVTPDELVPEIYVPERKGSLQAELLAATRRHDRVPYVLAPTLSALLTEVEAGKPVLVLQNLGLAHWPRWHYAVVIGYDPDKETFLLRSGTKRRLVTGAARFLASWERGAHWAMVVTPPAEPPASADPVRWLQATAPFESTGRLDAASLAYEAAVARWPAEDSAWTALGNVRYRQQRPEDAERAWRMALGLDAGGQSAAAWVARNNLASLLAERQCGRQARVLVDEGGKPPSGMATTWEKTLAAVAAAGDRGCR